MTDIHLGAGRLPSGSSDRTFYKLVDWPKIRKNAQVIAWLLKRTLKKEWGESVQVFANIGVTSIYLNVHTPGGKIAHVSIHNDARGGCRKVGAIHSKYDPDPGSDEQCAFTRIVARKTHGKKMSFDVVPTHPKSSEQQTSDDIAKHMSELLTQFSTTGLIGGVGGGRSSTHPPGTMASPVRMTDVHCRIWHP
jgi:hypothetical protein